MKAPYAALAAVACTLLIPSLALAICNNASFAAGTGTSGSPWEITTADQLANVNTCVGTSYTGKYFKLDNDIDLNVSPYNTGSGWTPIGYAGTAYGFYGNFDGGGHTISNMLISSSTGNYIGLFGYINGGSIANVTLSNVSVTGNNYVGGLIGVETGASSTISSVSVDGSITGGSYVGGMIGVRYYGALSYATTSVYVNSAATSSTYIGGMIGGNDSSGGAGRTIAYAYSSTTLTAAGIYVGGLIGYAYQVAANGSTIHISNSHSSGSVTGSGDVGGFAGETWDYNIQDSYSTANVYGTGPLSATYGTVGGFVGYLRNTTSLLRTWATGNVTSYGNAVGGLIGNTDNSDTVSQSYATGNVTGPTRVGGFVGLSGGTLADSYARGSATATSSNSVGAFAGAGLGSISRSYGTGAVSQASGYGFTGDISYTPSCSADYWDTTTTGRSTSRCTATGKSTSQMQQLSTYSGWDFGSVWGMDATDNGGYPFLLMQGYISYVQTITFNTQGGSAVSTMYATSSSAIILPAAPTKTGYTFTGWNTASDGSGTSYAAAASYTVPSGGSTLYAQWQANDTTPPSVSLTAPVGSEATSSTMTLSATSSDNVAVAGVKFYVNGALIGVEDTSAPYAVTWNTTATSSGTKIAYAVARDTSNNYATSSSVSFTVDNTPPSVSLTAPVASESTSSMVTLAASASDANTSVAGVKFYVDGALQGSEDVSAPFAISWDSTATSSGTHAVLAVARDIAGNYATSSTVSFSVANSGPTPILVAAAATGSSATITWSTSVGASSRVYFGPTASYGTSTLVMDISPRVTSHAVLIAGLPACSLLHYLVTGTDSVGNAATSSDKTFYTAGCTGNAPITASGQGAIATSTGGMLSQGHIALMVPIAYTATSSSATFEANQLDRVTFLGSAGTPSGKTAAGSDVFHLAALIDATTTLATFVQPITVTLSYSPSDIIGLNEVSLWIYRYDGSAWYPLSACVVDTTAKTVSCTTASFSDFAVFGTAAAASTPTVTAAGSNGPVYTGTAADLPGYIAPRLQTINPDGSIAYLGIASTSPPSITQSDDPAVSQLFTRTLRAGMSSSDVRRLQQYLNAQGFQLAAVGAGSPSSESDYFGTRTYDALVKFQEAHASEILAPAGLVKGSGIFGTFSRAFVNKMLSNI